MLRFSHILTHQNRGKHVSSEETHLMQVAEGLKRLPNFDKSAFLQLIEDTGPLVVLRILARFETGIQESLGVIQQGIAQENSDMIWKACHKLTGSAELIGFKEFGAKSRKLNLDVKALPDIQAHIDELQHYLKEGQELSSLIKESFPRFQDYL